MDQDKWYIELPQEAAERLKLDEQQKFKLRITEDGAQIIEVKEKHSFDGLGSVLIAGVISLIGFFAIFYNKHQIPLTGPLSTATLVIVVGGLSGMLNFAYHFVKKKKTDQQYLASNIYWRNFPTVMLSYTVLLTLVLLFLFRVIGQLFVGVSFDIYTSTMIGTLFVLVINAVMVTIAQTLTPSLLIRTLVAIILGGVTIAMITNKDQQWWLHNLSFLGTPEASNAWQFNLTLMLSALLMVALIDYLFVLLYNQYGKQKRLLVFKVLLLATAICLGGVGFFPYNESVFNQQMHNRSAGYLVYLFIILIVLLKWLLPSISKRFLQFSYVVAGGLLFAVFLFRGIDYLSLTAFELIAFVLAFTWLLMLLRILVNQVMQVGDEYPVQVIVKASDESSV